MKIAFALMVAAAVAGFGAATPARGGGIPAAAQAKAGQATVLGDLMKDWEAQKKTMMEIADAMPEDKYGFKTTPPQRNYGEQVMHVAQVNLGILKLIGGKAAPPSLPQNPKSKAEMMKALSDSYDWGTALLQEQTDATIIETVKAPAFLGPSTRARIFWFLMGHSMDIYGQMAVYLRLNGVVPPASRKGGV